MADIKLKLSLFNKVMASVEEALGEEEDPFNRVLIEDVLARMESFRADHYQIFKEYDE